MGVHGREFVVGAGQFFEGVGLPERSLGLRERRQSLSTALELPQRRTARQLNERALTRVRWKVLEVSRLLQFAQRAFRIAGSVVD